MKISKTEIVKQNESWATVKIHCKDAGSFIIEKVLQTEDSTINEDIQYFIDTICNDVNSEDFSKSDFYNETMRAMSKAESSDTEVFEFKLEAFSTNVKIYGRGQIPWKVFSRLADLNYDSDFGIEEFDGWITFNNTETFIQRAGYDGSEWWEVVRRPKLKDF